MSFHPNITLVSYTLRLFLVCTQILTVKGSCPIQTERDPLLPCTNGVLGRMKSALALPEPAALFMLCSISSTVSIALRLWAVYQPFAQLSAFTIGSQDNVTFCLTQLSRVALLYKLSLTHFVKVIIFHKCPDRVIYDIKSNVSKSPLLFTIWALHIYVQVVIFHNCSGIYDTINHMHTNLLSCYTQCMLGMHIRLILEYCPSDPVLNPLFMFIYVSHTVLNSIFMFIYVQRK